MVEQGGEGVGELAGGGLAEGVRVNFGHDLAAAIEHIVHKGEFEIGEVSILAVFVLVTQVILIAAPASEGFDRDIQLFADE